MILLILKYLIIFAVLFIGFAFSMDRHFRAEGYKGPVSDHFDGVRFFNIGGKEAVKNDSVNASSTDQEGRGRFAMIKWLLSSEDNPWSQTAVQETKPAERVIGSDIVVTYINHATVLIQTEGVNIITDPIYSRRASPVSWAGPARYAEPGVAFDDLPPIDVVLLSHDHYDHMDIGTLKRLRNAHHPAFFAPLGNKDFLARFGIESTELDWWQSADAARVSIDLVPAQHFSARALSDRNKTLWGGYVIRAKAGDIYFAGDTGYGPFVDQIKARYPGGFRLGFLPIGAFKPEWFMGEVHMSPDDAVRMKQELGIRQAVAVHFGTFKLAGDGQTEAMDRLRELASSTPDMSFRVLKNGESEVIHR